ncbi:tetraacyldisaccharide 4'-kinase [Flexibacterium corallicola]|uniref:tetraacyldisaccharide 4'-kinase n=1 Tax=Flexibacterium corallicola TaxID=3037259 RepID=UPI00286EEDE3|nr:tetraacyldisaccharide 4'-kinase [Pseudovibrio sp. M1P-2-3]
MKAPAFWWKTKGSWQSAVLSPLGAVYGSVSALSMKRSPRYHSTLPVVCSGNFTVGGSGKTPFSIALFDALSKRGVKPAFLLRGYGGMLQGPILVDPRVHRAEHVGDEALLLARTGPCVVSADRVAGAKFIERLGEVQVILMDDGFQNPSLYKDYSFVLVDSVIGIGNGKCLPAGPLRAPLQKQIPDAKGIVLVGEGDAELVLNTSCKPFNPPVFHAQIEPGFADSLEGERVLAFAGIGRPMKFFESLKSCNAEVVETIEFPDHHRFSPEDAEHILAKASTSNLLPVTTAKDYVRFKGSNNETLRELAHKTSVLEVSMMIKEHAALVDTVVGLLPTGDTLAATKKWRNIENAPSVQLHRKPS